MGSKISADNLITKSNQLIEAAYKLNGDRTKNYFNTY